MPTNVNCTHFRKSRHGNATKSRCEHPDLVKRKEYYFHLFGHKLFHYKKIRFPDCVLLDPNEDCCGGQKKHERPTPPPPKVPHRHATPHKCTCPSPLEIVRFYTLAIDTLTFFPDDGTRTTEHNAAIAFFSKELVKMRQRGGEKLVQLMKETSK